MEAARDCDSKQSVIGGDAVPEGLREIRLTGELGPAVDGAANIGEDAGGLSHAEAIGDCEQIVTCDVLKLLMDTHPVLVGPFPALVSQCMPSSLFVCNRYLCTAYRMVAR